MGKFMTLSNKNDIKMYLSGDNKKAEIYEREKNVLRLRA